MPRAREENERIKDERREKIENAATAVFARKGLAATKISDIAAEADMSIGLIYHYFGSKEELFELLVSRAIKHTLILLHQVQDQPIPASEKLRTLFSTMFTGMKVNPQVYMMVVQALTSEETSQELRRIITDQSSQYMQSFVEMIKQSQADGHIVQGNPPEMVEFLFVLIQGLAMAYAFFDGKNVSHITPDTILRFLETPR